jgi:peptide/nickel transport system permease protein
MTQPPNDIPPHGDAELATASRDDGLVDEPTSELRRRLRIFARNRTSLIGVVLIVLLVVAALFAPWLAPHDPLSQDVRLRLDGPSPEHLAGLDHYGRDIWSRIIYGSRISLMVGILSVALGGIVGSLLGVVAGFMGGRIEDMIMRLTDILLAFPDLITGLLVLAVIGPGLGNLIIAIGITLIPRFSRLAHGPTLALKEKEYVQSAISVGSKDSGVIFKHLVPNVRGELIVVASLFTATAIRVEANLSFVGLGVAPPTPTWGQMIRDGMPHLADAPWYSLTPGFAIFLAVLAFNLVGDGLRDAFDPKSRSR